MSVVIATSPWLTKADSNFCFRKRGKACKKKVISELPTNTTTATIGIQACSNDKHLTSFIHLGELTYALLYIYINVRKIA